MNKRLKILLLLAVLLLCSGCRQTIGAWLTRPQLINFTEREQAFLSREFGIDLSGEWRFTEGYQYPWRDPTTFYILELTGPAKLDQKGAEAFVRSRLGLDSHFGAADSVDDNTLFADLLTEGGWNFTHCCRREDIGLYWVSVFYSVQGDVVQVAIVYCAP